jgi:hypothetical protein
MKTKLLSSIIIYATQFTFGQVLPNRYTQEVFKEVQVSSGITFSSNIPTIKTTNLFGNRIANEESYGQVTVNLKMDIYTPVGDNLVDRPVVIFAFGGGFVNGNKTENSMVKLCQAYAKRGFVTASIDYRLGMNISNIELSKRAVYRAIQDGRSAVRFFRKNATTYKVNPNKIFIAGHSSGGFIALHNIYLDKDSERPASTRNYLGRLDLGGLDEIGDNKTTASGSLISGKANGAISFAGALGELSYIEGDKDIPTMFFHSSDDKTVPYNSGEPFSALNWLPGFNLPKVYGSNSLNTRAITTGSPKEFSSYTNRGHNVHVNGRNLYADIPELGSQFLFVNFLKPSSPKISGASSICENASIQEYSVPNTAYYYDWKISGGKFLNKDPLSNKVSIQWDDNATRALSVIPYSKQLAKGDITTLIVNTNLAPIISRDLNNVEDITNINLNDYFSDPEGDALEFKIATISKNNTLNNFKSVSNVLSIDNFNENIIIEAYDGSGCNAVQTILPKKNNPNILQVNAFPNPFVDNISLKLDGNYKGKILIEIYDSFGKLVSQKSLNKQDDNTNIDFSNQIEKSGFYVIKLSTNNSQITKKTPIYYLEHHIPLLFEPSSS